MKNEEFVKARYPDAVCIGPVQCYWPGQGERTRFLVLKAPHMSVSIAEGVTEEEAWTNAATRIDLAKSVKVMRTFKLKYREFGPHIYVTVLCGLEDQTLANCGELCFRKEEFWDLQDQLCGASQRAKFLFEEIISPAEYQK